jgi:hypothetical protein
MCSLTHALSRVGQVSRSRAEASVCIGAGGGVCVSEKWLLDSITQHRLMPLADYPVESD